MPTTYMPDADYRRLVDFLTNDFLSSLLKDQRDLVVMALGEKAGIWPEFTRPHDGEDQ